MVKVVKSRLKAALGEDGFGGWLESRRFIEEIV
jgi:hypothetical protein